MLEYIYVCRHGFRSNWVDPTIKTGPTGMSRDPPLAAYGKSQAESLAHFLSSSQALHPYPLPQRVFSSPFYRCIETAGPTALALSKISEDGIGGVMLDHGVMEWYSPVNPQTGLHPRPASPTTLSKIFPEDTIDTSYTSTLFPSRRGETLRDLHDRADLFVEAWAGRCEEMGVRCVVIFAHAASVIALGRALTGDKTMNIIAGCASTSLYRRRTRSVSTTPSRTTGDYNNSSIPLTSEPDLYSSSIPGSRSTTSLAAASSLLELASGSVNGNSGVDGDTLEERIPCGVGEWEIIWNGRADYLVHGVERDWSFRDVEIKDGEVVNDNGDLHPHSPSDELPVGLGEGMERYLRRGRPPLNGIITEARGVKADIGSRM